MSRDILNREDVALLVDSFYEKVKQDPVIGFLLDDVAKVDWPHHLPIMYDFWESVIYQKPGYRGNPMPVHMSLHSKSPLSSEHFNRWKQLFLETVNEHFEGPNAEIARQRAVSIATMIQIKTSAQANPGSLIYLFNILSPLHFFAKRAHVGYFFSPSIAFNKFVETDYGSTKTTGRIFLSSEARSERATHTLDGIHARN